MDECMNKLPEQLRIKSYALVQRSGFVHPVIQAFGYVGRRSEQAGTAGTSCRRMGGGGGRRWGGGGVCVEGYRKGESEGRV